VDRIRLMGGLEGRKAHGDDDAGMAENRLRHNIVSAAHHQMVATVLRSP